MDHFLIDIEEATVNNDHFRKVLFTAENSQLVVMSLKPDEEIGMETHHLDQFIRIEAGRGTARLNGQDYPLQDGSALVIPAGTQHNIINNGKQEALKLYTIYSPPEHKDGTVHRTKQDAEADREDHFDGKTTAMLQASRTPRSLPSTLFVPAKTECLSQRRLSERNCPEAPPLLNNPARSFP